MGYILPSRIGQRSWKGPSEVRQMLENLHKHLYGFKDTFFRTCGTGIVMLAGDRYEICNKRILNFIPFLCMIADVPLTLFNRVCSNNDDALTGYYKHLTEESIRRTDDRLFSFLEQSEIQYTQEGEELLSHSHGQLGADEVWRIRYGDFKKITTVDLVIYPQTTEEIEKFYDHIRILRDGRDGDGSTDRSTDRSTDKVPHTGYRYRTIPFGGGTNVTGCLLIKEKTDDDYIISIDMRRYNKVVRIDVENNYAIIQSGACGKEIEDSLNGQGFTMGHEPDSYEFSTLGGWISTNASGMRRSMYGNIEEIVVDFGYINEHTKKIETRYPVRHSHGPNCNSLFYGHEGNYGIITDVLVNIRRLPQERYFNSILFHNMTDGIRFLKEVYDANLRPSSIRLVDNEQFKFGQALKPEKTNWLDRLIDKLKKFYLCRVLRFDIDRMVACTLMIEGSPNQNKFIFKEIQRIAKSYNAIFGGSENGRAGYNLTHSIAYIRDFTMDYRIIGETFETSIEWNKAEIMAEAVKCVLKEVAAKWIKTKPFLSYRVSQSYNTGVCVYFTFGFYNDEDKTTEEGISLYHKMEQEMRTTMIRYGGSISHHHGIGQLKSDELHEATDSTQMRLHKSIKEVFDPKKMFCSNNFLA